MERLTVKTNEGYIAKCRRLDNGEFAGHKLCVDKLGKLEDLEEQGLLMKLRCKVGDKAYHIIEDNMAIPPIYISEHEIQDVSAKAVYFADDWWSFEEMREMNAYLNKAEAEKALADMRKKV